MKYVFIVLILFLSRPCRSQTTVGLIHQDAASADGYVLFAPLGSRTTYLVDKCGKAVHTWTSSHNPAQSAYLLPDGDLLRPANDSNRVFKNAVGGRIERFDRDSRLVWSYVVSDSVQCQHHDIAPMPNGNILVLVWEKKTAQQALSAGRHPTLLAQGLWSEKIIELQPIGKNAARVVWEWRVWDHLVQDFDPGAPGFGDVAKHPGLFNLNFAETSEEDWLHFNSIDYNPLLDQVMISNRNFSELFIIDHSTSTAEAASHAGGKSGKGGDILYRWGNPQAYNSGAAAGQKLFLQHHAHWIRPGLTDAGKIMVFNNGLRSKNMQENHSSVQVIDPPVDAAGNYTVTPGRPFGPPMPAWEYTAPVPEEFFSRNISGAQRLPNGNTLICSGARGKFFEIDRDKKIVWSYVNPVTYAGILAQGVDILVAQNPVFRCTFYPRSYSAFKRGFIKQGRPVELDPVPYECPTKRAGVKK